LARNPRARWLVAATRHDAEVPRRVDVVWEPARAGDNEHAERASRRRPGLRQRVAEALDDLDADSRVPQRRRVRVPREDVAGGARALAEPLGEHARADGAVVAEGERQRNESEVLAKVLEQHERR